MTASTTLQLKISRTKKRLSSNTWYIPLAIVACSGVALTLSCLLRVVAISGIYGLVELEIPVLSVPLEDNSYKRLQTNNDKSIQNKTPIIMLTNSAFIFGSTEAFTTDFTNIRNKFYIPHVDGSPNVPKLLSDIARWQKETATQDNTKQELTAIFLPDSDIPMPIVIQCIEMFKASGIFRNVVLGGGLK